MDKSPLTSQEFTELARERASLLAFLNIHFNNLPDQTFIRHIRGNDFQSALQDLQAAETDNIDLLTGARLMYDYVHSTIDMDTVQLSNALGVDRTRLYRGISPSYGPPPPYEAVWSKTGKNVTAVLQKISGIYQADGMTVSPEAKDRLDYIGVELDYVYQLAMREADAWNVGDEDKARGLLQRQDQFLREHLGHWTPLFVEKALTMVETDFYRGHLLMLRGLIVEEQARIQALLDEMRTVA